MSIYQEVIDIAEREIQSIENIPVNERTQADNECYDTCIRVIENFSRKIKETL